MSTEIETARQRITHAIDRTGHPCSSIPVGNPVRSFLRGSEERMLGPMRVGVPILLLAACGAPEATSNPGALPNVPVQRSLPAGTVLGLRPVEVVREGELDGPFVNGLMRVAMVQSARFDFAVQTEGFEATLDVAVQVDPQALVLTTTLYETGQAPIPLAHASYGDQGLPAAVDILALGTRQALGENLDRTGAIASALAFSGEPRCVQRTEEGLALAVTGDIEAAERLLREARRHDGGSPVVLDAIARLQAMTGQTRNAMVTANEGLRYEARLTPTTRHRLARTQLQAEASLVPRRAVQQQDLQLLTLAETFLRERPHDPQVLYSKALALNFLSRFDESAPLLRRLRLRLPRNATVAYHLAFAELATNQYEEALNAIQSTHGLLPRAVTVLPESLALYHTDRQEELRELLAELADLSRGPADVSMHEVLRMQASHALLTGQREAAIRALVEDMEWMRQRPSMLEPLTLDLVENGEVLIRLGATAELRRMIVGLQELRHLSPTYAQGMLYLGGLLEVKETGGRAMAAEATLAQEEKQVWGNALRAMGYRERGELMQEATALAEASIQSDSALILASLATAWQGMGRQQEAEVVLSELEEKLLTINLRLPLQHPLLNPARALAYLATQR